MGTNYYLQYRKDKESQIRETLHICKTSYGWTPSIQAYPELELNNWFEWILFLKTKVNQLNGIIYNEYFDEISVSKFIHYIIGKQQNGGKNHAEYMLKDIGIDKPDLNWVDNQGYSMSAQDFS